MIQDLSLVYWSTTPVAPLIARSEHLTLLIFTTMFIALPTGTATTITPLQQTLAIFRMEDALISLQMLSTRAVVVTRTPVPLALVANLRVAHPALVDMETEEREESSTTDSREVTVSTSLCVLTLSIVREHKTLTLTLALDSRK